jgi:alkylation response protein AidB-like acyl-CoA dehydrogenase
MTMDFAPTQAQTALATLTRKIVDDRAGAEQLRQLDQRLLTGGDRFDPQLWAVLAETGVLAAALPEDVGGDGFGLLEQCSVLIELGRAVAPAPYLPTIAMAGSVLARFGTPEQQAEWLKPALDGHLILTVALAEPDGGDLLTPSTRAEPIPTGWSLTGAKATVPAGPLAHFFLVSATTPDGAGLFVVARDDVGLQISRQRMTDHDDAAWLDLSAVQLPADRRLGPLGRTGDEGPVAWVLQRGTVALCAYQLGVLERALALTAEYAGTRIQFDRPIGSFQAVGQRLADAYIQVQALRLALWNAAWSLDPSAVATAKFWAAEAGHYVAHTCIHVHGGAGIDVENQVHRYFLAAKRTEFELGGATAQLLTLGALLAE